MSATATTSEAYLLSLARRAFLRMWSYPNLHNDKGKRPGGTGKELCDLLVIFGNDVVIFSDKHCSLDTEVEIGIAWPRWYKKAVLESSDQVRGAERWLLTQPSRVFEDTYCQQRLRVRLPREPKIHRVLTVRGAAAVARSEWAGRGSLVVTNRRLDACTAAPFRIGAFDGHNRMYHVFDENALDAILTTLDTAADFIRYLDGREAFFRKASSVTAFSEEDLLAKYMLSYDDTQHGLHFPESSGGDDVYIDGDHWNRWSRSAQRAARDAANSVSYAWDALVNEFLKHAYGGTQYRTTHSELADQEELMRWLACEDRFRRRMLAQSLLEMVRTTPPEHLRRRYYPPVRPGSPYWVFLVLPRLPEYSVDDYRLARQELLLKHLQVVKYLHPDALDLVGIAVDTNMVEMSEDAMFLDARGWTNELNEEARRDYEELGIFANGTTIERRYEEYPVSWWLRRRRNV